MDPSVSRALYDGDILVREAVGVASVPARGEPPERAYRARVAAHVVGT
jgi:hypothetical protein